MDKERLAEIIGSVKTAFDMVISDLEGCAGFDKEQTERDRDDAIRLLMKQVKQRFFVDENGKWTPLPIVTKWTPPPKVTRCKDCKWGDPTRNEANENMIFCYNGETGIEDGYLHEPDWFCAEGEPKEGENDA